MIPKIIIKHDVHNWIAEDLPFYDISSSFVPNKKVTAVIIAKQEGIVCGLEIAEEIFSQCGTAFLPLKNDGAHVKKLDQIAQINGMVRDILIAERTALNILGHLSGIATQTNKLVSLLTSQGLKTRIAATRKTLPGLRRYEKYAVEIGGGDTHRLNLSDMVLLKENHLAEFESVTQALQTVKDKISFSKKIEIEVTNETEALEAASTGLADIIMLDNFSPDEIRNVIHKIKKIDPNVLIEASGGITPHNLVDYATAGVDIISMGYLTHSVKNFDLSLLVKTNIDN